MRPSGPASSLATEDVAAPAPSPAAAASPWRVALVPFVVSRVISDALIAGFVLIAGRPMMTEGFAKWDGGWYLRIASDWYPAHPVLPFHFGEYTAWPFFPLLPSILRAAGWVSLPMAETGVVVNHLAFYVALVGLYRLASRHVSPRVARLALWSLALFPFAFVFSMVYPSSILLAAVVWALLLVENRLDWSAGLAVLVATMVRPNGFVVAIAIAVGLRHQLRRLVAICAPSVVFLSAWMVYNAERAGDALAFYKAKAGWEEITIFELPNDFRPFVTAHFVLALVALGLVVAAVRWMPRSWIALAAVYLLPSMLLGIHGLGRYSNECFPSFVAAGRLLDRWKTQAVAVVLAASVVVQGATAWVVISRVHGAAP